MVMVNGWELLCFKDLIESGINQLNDKFEI
jgi:hypothetical protein